MNKYVYTELLRESVEKHSDYPCMHIKRNGVYKTWLFSDFKYDINSTVSSLLKLGFNNNFNAVIIGENIPEWTIAYHSVVLSGGCTVPLDPFMPYEEIREIFKFTEASIVFCTARHFITLKKIIKECDALKRIVIIDHDTFPGQTTLSELIRNGRNGENAFLKNFKPDDPVAIIFTSGTTGNAKGVVLSQKNFTAACLYGIPRMKLSHKDTFLAVLPLNHVFGFSVCVAAALTNGIDVVYVPQIKGPLILEALKEKQVSVLPAVPKLLTVMLDNIERKVRIRGILFSSVFSVLKFLSDLLGPVFGTKFRRILFHSVHSNFGGNLQVIISGGASLGGSYFRGFSRMGFTILEGYGLTETFGPITVCHRNKPVQGSVGPPLNENEAKIINPNNFGIGEVLLRGTTLFKGYYKNDKLTSEAFDEKNWFCSGDLGKITDDGYLHLYGRCKDLIVLPSGKNVYPNLLEEFYQNNDKIEEIGIFGLEKNGRERVAAVILPSEELRKQYSKEDVQKIIQKEITEMGKNRPAYKKINDFIITYDPLERTSTKKLIKPRLISKYKKLFDYS